MLIQIPDFSLVVLIGCSGSGKTTFAERHFPSSAIISSDACRHMVSDQNKDFQASLDASNLIQTVAGMRLKRRLRTVIDACNLTIESRKPLVELARRYHARLIAVVFDVPLEHCIQQQRFEDDAKFDESAVLRQHKNLQNQRRSLNHEGFHEIYTLRSYEDIGKTLVRWVTPTFDKREAKGPFDVIGDIHGCATELFELLETLGYTIENSVAKGPQASHPAGRRLVFVGDLVDRGPAIVPVLQLVMNSVKSGAAYCVIGNHENKLIRFLAGRKVKLSHGLEKTIEQLDRAPPRVREDLFGFLNSLSDHLILDDEKLVVAHAGIREEFIGRSSGEIRSFCLYGETNGELDEYGLPIRLPWARNYFGDSLIVYGHTPVAEPQWTHNTVNIDTGCVYGGALSCLRYPEKLLVSIPAKQTYYEPRRPFKDTNKSLGLKKLSLPIPTEEISS